MNQAVRRHDLSAGKNDQTILFVWRQGVMDTLDIAKIYRTSEAHVYNVIAGRHDWEKTK